MADFGVLSADWLREYMPRVIINEIRYQAIQPD